MRRLDSNFGRPSLRHEIVVVDDGSIDDTCWKARYYARNNEHVRILSYVKNAGKGFAVKTGFLQAAGDVVVILDSDLDIDARQVDRFVDALRYGDFVIGSKYHPESIVEISSWRRFLSQNFNMLCRLLTGIKVRDTQVGIKAIRRSTFLEIFRRMTVKRYAFDVELLVLANLYKLKIIELPVRLKVTNAFSLKEIWHMALDLLGIAYRLRVKKHYQRGSMS